MLFLICIQKGISRPPFGKWASYHNGEILRSRIIFDSPAAPYAAPWCTAFDVDVMCECVSNLIFFNPIDISHFTLRELLANQIPLLTFLFIEKQRYKEYYQRTLCHLLGYVHTLTNMPFSKCKQSNSACLFPSEKNVIGSINCQYERLWLYVLN